MHRCRALVRFEFHDHQGGSFSCTVATCSVVPYPAHGLSEANTSLIDGGISSGRYTTCCMYSISVCDSLYSKPPRLLGIWTPFAAVQKPCALSHSHIDKCSTVYMHSIIGIWATTSYFTRCHYYSDFERPQESTASLFLVAFHSIKPAKHQTPH